MSDAKPSSSVSARMPAIFFGHGSPGNVMEDNKATRTWERLGREMPRPKAIICVSAHWYIRGTQVTAMPSPRTIHDFGGFPKVMYDMRYTAPGSPELAEQVAERLAPIPVSLDKNWGFDHGSWCVLCKVFPKADIPVVQLSIDLRKDPSYHFEVGKKLASFRDEGVLVMGSGNIVHNLPVMNWRMRDGSYDWADRFGDTIRKAITENKPEVAVEYEKLGQDAELAVPSPDHYLPLLYVLGARRPDDKARFETSYVEYGSLDMTTVVLEPHQAA